MRLRTALVAAVLACLVGANAAAQQATGEIFGRAVDKSGAVLPGATVTVAGPALLQPRVGTTSATGTYRVPELPIGIYSVTFELAGFRTIQRADVRVNIGFSAQINAEMELSAVQETVTVTGESPLIDTKATGTKSTFDLETLQNIPSARDPWVMLERSPGITMDRVNVGGNQSGQQSGYISRGSSTGNNKWSVDGVDITDMAATGASPIYYDFDMLEEMQVTTGGADVMQQTGGVGINLVTRNGTDRFKGSGRLYITDDNFQADNIDAGIPTAGAGAPIQNIRDYGFELGGPIKKGKAWYWGSYGIQDIKVGVVGFYKAQAGCSPPPTETDALRACLETDLTTLNNYNWKVQWAPINGNKLSFQNTYAAKVRNARDASSTRPIETTYRQKAVSGDFGAAAWLTGPSPLWKAGDQHVFNDRFLMDVQWAHLGNNFTLDFHEDSLKDVQPRFETTTSVWGRSFQQSVFLRPTNSLDVNGNYFLPNSMGGDHAFKFGVRWRSAHSTSLNHFGGNAVARYTGGVPNSVDVYRDGASETHLDTWAFMAQDTYSIKRATITVGFRVDRQDDSAVASTVPASPMAPAGLPAIDFPGIDAGIIYTDFSPRVGINYDLSGTGRTVARASYSTYFGQVGPGQFSAPLASVGATMVRYPWADLNGDAFVQTNEITYGTILASSGGYNVNNPTNFRTTATVDPNVKNDRTREFIAGFDHELFPGIGVGFSYIWRKYDQFAWNDRIGLTSNDFRSVSYTPTVGGPAPACPNPAVNATAQCETITYFEPVFSVTGLPVVYTNQPDRFRDYNGFELTMGKRMANRWSANGSFAFNNAIDHWESGAAFEDPTNIAQQEGFQYAPESGGSGQDSIFTNAKWLVKMSGMWTSPLWDINFAGAYNGRQGYPFPQSVLTPNKANGGGTSQVLLDPLGSVRLDSLHTMDLRIDRAVTFGSFRMVPSMDIFNLLNTNTILAYRRQQAATNANDISAIVAPRVIRFGVRMSW